MRKNIIKVVATTLATSVFYLMAMGCDDPYVYQPPKPTYTDSTDLTRKAVRGGFIHNKNMTIKAEDSSFILKAGEQFEAPFQSDLWSCFKGKGDLIDKADLAIRCGARRVDILVEGREESYYGILALNTSVEAAYGPAARSYLIRVPEDKWKLANNGNTVAVFESMKYSQTGFWSNGKSVENERTQYGWILWISTYPIR